MSTSINITIPLNDLAAAIAEQLAPVINGLKAPPLNTSIQPEKYLNRKETAALLNVSLVTLNEYTKQGKIKGYRFGSRVLYKQSEIANSLQQIKRGGYV